MTRRRIANGSIALGAAGVVACIVAFAVRVRAVQSAWQHEDDAWERHRARVGKMVEIPASHAVAGFEIDRTEVTVLAYRACMDAGACSAPSDGKHCNASKPDRGAHPMNCVDQQQAASYCSWTGRRLPTRDEWLLASSGPGGTTFPWGDQKLDGRDCFARHRVWTGPYNNERLVSEELGTCAVDAHPAGATPLGVLGMGGNVAEWTSSELSESEQRSNRWVVLGASWIMPLRDAKWFPFEGAYAPGHRDSLIGFRCARGARGSLWREAVR
jgi:formylglycine-generating enzyme required for sulfatase activity